MRDKIRGKAQNLRGRVKEAAGSLSGNRRRQAEGTADRVRGATREGIGEARRSVGEGLEDLSRRVKK
jgi:uncharacterized protein YjbJ (UPF0337 family)